MMWFWKPCPGFHRPRLPSLRLTSSPCPPPRTHTHTRTLTCTCARTHVNVHTYPHTVQHPWGPWPRAAQPFSAWLWDGGHSPRRLGARPAGRRWERREPPPGVAGTRAAGSGPPSRLSALPDWCTGRLCEQRPPFVQQILSETHSAPGTVLGAGQRAGSPRDKIQTGTPCSR